MNELQSAIAFLCGIIFASAGWWTHLRMHRMSWMAATRTAAREHAEAMEAVRQHEAKLEEECNFFARRDESYAQGWRDARTLKVENGRLKVRLAGASRREQEATRRERVTAAKLINAESRIARLEAAQGQAALAKALEQKP